MHVSNRDGDPVDPVPFIVTTGLTVTIFFSTGPLFGLSYGLTVAESLTVAAALSVVAVVVGYHRLVWTAVPRTVTVPAKFRFQRLLYLAAAFGLALLAVCLPLMF